MKRGWEELFAVAAGGILVGVLWQKRRAAAVAPAAPPAVPPALQNTAYAASVDVTVAPHQNASQAVPIGSIVIAWLPLGGRWVSVDGAGVTGDTLAPQPFEFQGPVTHTYVWADTGTNTTQTSVINYTVATPVPVVTT